MQENNLVMEQDGAEAPKKGKKKYVALLIIVLVAIAGWFYYKKTQSPEWQSAQQEKKVAEMTANLGKLISLPKDEEPAVFEIKDPTLLSSQQPFFAGAEKGDELFVYSKSAKAIIYNPTKNIIVNVGPISFDKNTQTPGTENIPQATSTKTTKTR